MELIEDAINREDIKSYDYTEFSALEKIGAGGYGLKNLQKVYKHQNVVEFYGVTRDYENVSIDDIAENINVNQHYEDIQNELNGDNLGNQDESESIPHPRDYRAMNLNEFGEIDTNNNIAVIMNNDSEETIRIQIKTIVDLWNFFVKYFLKPGLLRVFQSRSRDAMAKKS
ncbi:hypothetical protein F8M41_008654 [Gigaspora margarita]|uniref:Uncharacterized protein n=1 Tax=Gigaspora margarita TaxID=4874 RepID=A0A8H3X4R6_GIGMA|nr:hypothetical protein F8M41_008654 [Gigaspora margarita]